MTSTDIITLIIILLLLSAIIFFSFILPKIQHKNKSACSSCYMAKKAKRLTKDYHKKHNKKK